MARIKSGHQACHVSTPEELPRTTAIMNQVHWSRHCKQVVSQIIVLAQLSSICITQIINYCTSADKLCTISSTLNTNIWQMVEHFNHLIQNMEYFWVLQQQYLHYEYKQLWTNCKQSYLFCIQATRNQTYFLSTYDTLENYISYI